MMKTGWKVAIGITLGIVGVELIRGLVETNERFEYYKVARDYCDSVGKPLLRIGMKRHTLEPPNGDYTLDLDPDVVNLTDSIGVQGDERQMPFSDRQFGACFNEHTLEHLPDATDVEKAVNECRRVADMAVLLCPSPYGIYSSVFAAGHRLRLWFDNDSGKIIVRKNNFHAPFTFIDYPNFDHHNSKTISQAMILRYEELKLPVIIDG